MKLLHIHKSPATYQLLKIKNVTMEWTYLENYRILVLKHLQKAATWKIVKVVVGLFNDVFSTVIITES
jgi:hypothetical protein